MDCVHEVVDRWLSLLEERPLTKGGRGFKLTLPLSSFKRVVPIFERPFQSGMQRPEGGVCFADVMPADLDWPIDIGLLHSEPEHLDNMEFLISRVRSVTPAEVRGRVQRVSRYMLRELVLWPETNGKLSTADIYYAHLGGQWVDATAAASYRPNDNSTIDQRIGAFLGLAFNRRYEWGVEFGREDGPTLMLPTDPSGIRAMFKDRDVPSGMPRRQALLHWVRAHFRRNRRDPDDLAWIRKHLRGAWSFSWQGMSCVIHPSAYDLEQAAV
jgi:hypothetical protein